MRYSRSKLSIRKLDRADIDRVELLERESFDDPWPRAGIEHEVTDFNGLCFGVSIGDGGELVAYVLGRRVLDEGHLLNFAVQPEYRRKGIAGRLLDHFERQGAARGVSIIYLEVRADNRAARELYLRDGYHMVSVRPHYYKDKVDAIIMKKRIG